MIIRMGNGTTEIEWRVAGTVAMQFDPSGTHDLLFESYHEACVWVMDQVVYAQSEMGMKFI